MMEQNAQKETENHQKTNANVKKDTTKTIFKDNAQNVLIPAKPVHQNQNAQVIL